MKTFFWMILFLGSHLLVWGQPSRAQKVLDMENRLQKLEETLSRLRGGEPPQAAPTLTSAANHSSERPKYRILRWPSPIG